MSAPKHLIHRGSVLAAGVLIHDTTEKRAWVLEHYVACVAVHSTSEGLLVRFSSPSRMDTELAPGLVLTDTAGLLSALPLSAADLLASGASLESFVMARGGKVISVRIGPPVDLSTWIDVSGFRMVAVEPLPAPPRPIEAATTTRAVNMREFIRGGGGVQPTLQQANQPRPSLFAEWMTSLRAFIDRLRRQRDNNPPPTQHTEIERPARPSLWERFSRAVLDPIAQALANSALGPLFRERQSKYFDELQALFDQGNLDEALRRAIPLDDKPAAPNAAPALGVPGRRDSLSISLQSHSNEAPARVMAAGAFDQLQARYRAAAEKLITDGRIEEAAFVYADLLKLPNEAVALLEKHGKFRLAAELAEARSLPGDLQVRLWLRAGELQRALAIARRGHFHAAIVRLEKDQPDLANQLRLSWADTLASSGDFVGAAAVLQKVPNAAPLRLKFIDLALEVGGVRAVPLIMERVDLDPACAMDMRQRALAIVQGVGENAALLRLALADAVSDGKPDTLALRQGLGRDLLRALLRDQGNFETPAEPAIKKLLALDDGPLRADFPSLATKPPRQRPHELHFPRDSISPVPLDAVLTPDRRLLVANGHNGVALHSADGRLLNRFDGSISRFVAGEGLVLGLEPRLEATAIERISLSTRTMRSWPSVQLTREARTFHDGLWFVSRDNTLMALDISGEAPVAVWQVGGLPGLVTAIAADATRLSVLIGQDNLALELWTYELPSLTLRTRWTIPPEALLARGISADGAICFAGAEANGEFVCSTRRQHGGNRDRWLVGPPVSQPCFSGAHVAIAIRRAPDIVVEVLPTQTNEPSVRLVFEQATRATIRSMQGAFVIAADNGRVVAFDMTSHRVIAQLPSRAATP